MEDTPRVVVAVKRGRFTVGELLFERGGQIPLGGGKTVRTGRMALVSPGRGRSARGRVLRELGDPGKARDVVEALLLDRGFSRGFGKKIEDEAREAAAAVKRDPGSRRDLTDLPTFTIDPVTARDFDDAVSAKREADGVRLWIHIADVAAHVRPGSRLEKEARRRANSTYAPATVEPMLPKALSNEACSLVAGEDRFAVTTEVVLSGDGAVRSAEFYRSRIRSNVRFAYEQIDEFFTGRKRPPEEVAEPLELMRAAAAALGERRAGSQLEVVSAEPDFVFEGGDVVGAKEEVQTESHRLIEMLMILANEQVAELLSQRKIPALYRVHERPDPERIEYMVDKLAALGIPTPQVPERISPQQAGDIAVEASRLVAREAERRGHGREAYTSLVLRSLMQAQYNERNLGHAGLGSSAYCHFTSPIRRFPDLVCHRGLLSAVGEGEEPARAETLAADAAWCSERERDSMRLERSADDVCAAFLLEREVFEAGPGAPFEGEVSGLVPAGAFVRFEGELASVYEGFMPARRIGGRERYELNDTETALVGNRDGGAIRLGDPVTVTVDRVEAPRGRVDLLPAAGAGAGGPGGER